MRHYNELPNIPLHLAASASCARRHAVAERETLGRMKTRRHVCLNLTSYSKRVSWVASEQVVFGRDFPKPLCVLP